MELKTNLTTLKRRPYSKVTANVAVDNILNKLYSLNIIFLHNQ